MREIRHLIEEITLLDCNVAHPKGKVDRDTRFTVMDSLTGHTLMTFKRHVVTINKGARVIRERRYTVTYSKPQRYNRNGTVIEQVGSASAVVGKLIEIKQIKGGLL